MTGLRPSTTGIYGMISDEKVRSENPATKDILFLPEYFRNNGYHTMGIGKLFHTHAPEGAFNESGGKGLAPFLRNGLSGMVLGPQIENTMVEPAPIGALFLKLIP